MLPLQRSLLTACPLFKKRRRSAFTLVELLVTMSILTLVSVVLIAILGQSSAMVAQGAVKVQLHQKSRSALQRISPYVMTAVAGPGSGESALIYPTKTFDASTPEELEEYVSLRFHTTEDFLADDYDPKATWDPANETYVYEIAFDTSAGRTYTTQETTSNPAQTFELGEVLLRKVVGGVAVDTPQPKVLAHRVVFFSCYAVTSNCVEVQIRTAATRKGPQGNQIDVIQTENAVVPLPSQSL